MLMSIKVYFIDNEKNEPYVERVAKYFRVTEKNPSKTLKIFIAVKIFLCQS
jgi:hypothetical protein